MEQNKNRMKAMTVHPTEAIRQAAVEARSLFDKYGDPIALAQKQESGVLHNLLQDLKAIDNSKQTLLTARQTDIVKERRIATDNAYRSLVECKHPCRREWRRALRHIHQLSECDYQPAKDNYENKVDKGKKQ